MEDVSIEDEKEILSQSVMEKVFQKGCTDPNRFKGKRSEGKIDTYGDRVVNVVIYLY